MSDLMREIQRRVRVARIYAGLTQAQVAYAMGMGRTTVAKIESGVRAVRADELAQLARLCGVWIDWLSGAPAPMVYDVWTEERDRC